MSLSHIDFTRFLRHHAGIQRASVSVGAHFGDKQIDAR
jgi:hypothetical protein